MAVAVFLFVAAFALPLIFATAHWTFSAAVLCLLALPFAFALSR